MDIIEKRKMAHELALKVIDKVAGSGFQPPHGKKIVECIASDCWDYADAMEAEENKRKPKGTPDALRDGA